jgi:5-methylcytosine-specific restriction endonuclease McrBC regulatory subunit McrC
MARDIVLHELKDWSQLGAAEELLSDIDISRSDANFGIHKYKEKLYTSGFVGVGRVYKHDQTPIQSNGKEHIVIITSRFGMNPWGMLEKVMCDDEYEDYIEELKRNNKTLYEVFYDQPLIRLAQNERNDGELLYALSFVHSCYFLCRKGLKKTIIHKEDNYRSKVKGRIDIKKNIATNTFRGRNDRFYCKYIDFTEDNIENRILKSTLKKCKEIIRARFELNSESTRRIAFCINAFRHVSDVTIASSDFNSTTVSGLYIYYKPALQQAKGILSQKYYSYAAGDGTIVSKSVYTIPYMINMETLFEFYARAILKGAIDSEKYNVDKYSLKWYLMKGTAEGEGIEKGVHLTTYCIPDIVIRDVTTNSTLAVFDVKYKPHGIPGREDSYQLLAYTLLTGVNKCGFVFPGSETMLKQMQTSGTDNLLLNTPLMDELKYFELTIGDDLPEGVLKQMLG